MVEIMVSELEKVPSCCTSREQKRHYEWHHSFETSRPTASDLCHLIRPHWLILPKQNFNWVPNIHVYEPMGLFSLRSTQKSNG